MGCGSVSLMTPMPWLPTNLSRSSSNFDQVVALKAVDGAVETHQRVEGDHTRTLCAQVRVVVSAIEQVVDTWFVRDCSEESSHICE